MLSIDNVSLSKGRTYYEKENYYSKESAKEYSEWQGKLAGELGLNGKVDFDTFDKLLFGYDKNGKSIATNSIDPKKYREPEITKKERGNLDFTISKMCEIYPFKENEYKKICDIVKFHTRHKKKITVGDKESCLSQIKNIMKKTALSVTDRENSIKAFEAAISKVTRPKERRAGYDLTFSVPKSASIMALVHKDNDVLQAHRDSVLKVLDYIEAKYANTRIGDNIKREIENTKKLLIAKFEHNTSRENDPQLHTHCVVLNLIQREDGEWRSLHADEFRNNSKLFGAIYQNEFAHKMYELGYDITSNKDGTFKITNVPHELSDCFSKRRKQMVEQGVTDQKSARKLVYINRAKKGENLDQEEQHKHWLDETKQTGTDLSKIKGSARTRTAFDKAELISSIHDSFSEASKMKMAFKYEEAFQHFVINNHGKYQVISKEIIEIFDKEAANELIQLYNKMFITKISLEMETKTREALEKTSQVKSILNLSKEEIENLIREKSAFTKEKKEAVLQDLVQKTSHIVPEISLQILEIAKHYLHENIRISFEENKQISSLISEVLSGLKMKKDEKKELKADLNFAIGKATELTEGQKEAITNTLSSTDMHNVWLGVAGAGKTFSLATVVEQAKLAGYHVEGFAQNKKAATVLSKETGMEVNTIAKLLMTGSTPTQKEKIWIVDEAGMIGTKLGHDFVLAAKQENARLIIVGDNRQLSSPTAGHFLKLAANYTNLKKMHLNQSLRQKDDDLSKGVEILNSIMFEKLGKQSYKVEGKALVEEALSYFKSSIVELKTEDARISHMVNDYLTLNLKERDKTLLVARTHKAISQITEGIREKLKNEGFLKNETLVDVYSAIDLNDSKSKYAANYEPGNLIIFQDDIKLYYGNETFKAKANQEYIITQSNIINNLITIMDKKGNKHDIDPSIVYYKNKDIKNKQLPIVLPVYKKDKMNISENDHMCWNRNIWETKRVNKQEFKVLKIDKNKNTMKIMYENGTKVDVDLTKMNFMQHAWAVTYNAAQGDTKKNTIGIVDGFSSLEDIYTLFTRPTHNLKVYIESSESLKKSMMRSGSKKTATELVTEKKEIPIIMSSNKMDFYDKYQRNISFDNDKTFISFTAPSDISSLLFTANEEQQIKIIQSHEKAVQESINKVMQLTGLEIQYKSITNKSIFNDNSKGLSTIQHLNSNLEITRVKGKDGNIKPLNKFVLIENQGIIKNLYQNHLCENLNSNGIECFNVDGIIRAKDRNDHVHALFAEHFEMNLKALERDLKEKGFDKFASTFEIEKFGESFSGKLHNTLDWENIKKDSINEVEYNYIKKDKESIIRDTIISLSKDLQVFNETKLYETLLSESKGNIKKDEINEIHAKLLLHNDIRFVAHDKFGKMVLAHKDLNHEEANILTHSTTRNEEKNHILSFERMIRRAEKKSFSENKTAALAHCTVDQGAIKFLSGLTDKEAKPVLNETKKLYINSGFKVFSVYAGTYSGTSLNDNSDMHLGYLLNKIKEKKIVLNNKSVIILKDIGNNISKNASELFDIAKENGSKVIFHANENDFKEGEKKTFLKNLKKVTGVHLKNRFTGIQKQKKIFEENFNKQNKNKHNILKKINIESYYDEKKKVNAEEYQRLSGIMLDIQKFYTNNLFSEQGKEAVEYLIKRGFTREQIQEYGFGLSYTKGLEEYAKAKGYSKKDLVSLSLITEKDDGNSYDFYRNRIMIPINDSNGNCIGFGGRIYRKYEIDKKVSKYINPKNTVLFDKKSTLFGLDKAKEAIKEQREVIVVEGYMDAIALQKSGINNVVAVMGTSLTRENIDQLSTFSKEVTLLFDNDNAGRNAAKLSYGQALNSDLKLSFASVTSGKDPDEFIKEHGQNKFKEDVLDKKIPLNFFVNSSFVKESNNYKYSEILNWQKEILPKILQIEDPIQRNFEIRGASIAMDIPLTQLLQEKHYKFIPTAFLTEEEAINRKEYFNKISKNNSNKNEIKKFDNSLNSKNSVRDILQNAELKKGLIYEMEKQGINFKEDVAIQNFADENKKIVNDIKEIIHYNETIIFIKELRRNSDNPHILDVYKNMNETYNGLYPQEISQKLFDEEILNQKQNRIKNDITTEVYQSNKLMKAIENGAIPEEISLFKSNPKFENRLNLLAYQFASAQIELANKNTFNATKEKEVFIDSRISIDNFKSFLQEKRLEEVLKHQELLMENGKKNLINEIEKNFNLKSELDRLNFNKKEKIFSKIFPDQTNKNLSESENLKKVNDFYQKINENMNERSSFIKKSTAIIFEDINQEINIKKTNHKEREKENISLLKENISLKEKVKLFEVKMKDEILNKISDKQNLDKVFDETRKVLVKESTFIERNEKNPYKAYLNLAKEENVLMFKDIINDIDLRKIESKFITQKNDTLNSSLNNTDNEKFTKNIITNVFKKSEAKINSDNARDIYIDKIANKAGIKNYLEKSKEVSIDKITKRIENEREFNLNPFYEIDSEFKKNNELDHFKHNIFGSQTNSINNKEEKKEKIKQKTLFISI